MEHDNYFQEFLKELKREIEFHANGGTSYRMTTAEYALQIARLVGKFPPFLDRKSTEKTVAQVQPNLSSEKKEDIVKMLNTIAKDQHCKVNMPNEIRQYIQEKRKNNQSLSFREKDGEEK